MSEMKNFMERNRKRKKRFKESIGKNTIQTLELRDCIVQVWYKPVQGKKLSSSPWSKDDWIAFLNSASEDIKD